MTVNPTTNARLANFNVDTVPAPTQLNSMPTDEELQAIQALEQGYLELAKSIVESSGNASWTGWNWRENDPT